MWELQEPWNRCLYFLKFFFQIKFSLKHWATTGMLFQFHFYIKLDQNYLLYKLYWKYVHCPKISKLSFNSPKTGSPYRNSSTELLREWIFNFGNRRKTSFMFPILKKKGFINSRPLNWNIFKFWNMVLEIEIKVSESETITEIRNIDFQCWDYEYCYLFIYLFIIYLLIYLFVFPSLVTISILHTEKLRCCCNVTSK